MSANVAIRAGVLAEYQALESAGLNTFDVTAVFKENIEPESPVTGKEPTADRLEYIIKPNPQVTFQSRQRIFETGAVNLSDVELKGAFFDALAGTRFNETYPSGREVTKEFKTASEVVQWLQNASYFLIDGIRYIFRSGVGSTGGYIRLDASYSEWTMRLLRDEMQ